VNEQQITENIQTSISLINSLDSVCWFNKLLHVHMYTRYICKSYWQMA